jgi:regulatory protein
LKVRALQWLAQREHSRQELRDKLLRRLQRSLTPEHDKAGDTAGSGDPATGVEAVLVWLEQHGHLSDARFTESRVHARQSRFGNRRIQQELQQHGLALDADARQALAQTELARANEVWRRRYGAPATDAAGRLRQMRFLAGRGFSMEVVHRVVKTGAPDADSLPSADDNA